MWRFLLDSERLTRQVDDKTVKGLNPRVISTFEMTPGFKPFTVLRSLGRQSERLANDYISYASNVRRIRQQLWFNHQKILA